MKANRTFLVLTLLASTFFAGCGGSNSSNDGGGGNNDNPTPNVSSISPSSGVVGNAEFTLTVSGSNFVSSSVVLWNGSNRTTSFGSASQLTATISASDLAFAGSAQVSVSTPAPGGGNSSALSFSIAPQIANGIGLPGDSNYLAINALSDVPPVTGTAGDVENNVILNRLSLRFAKDATVGQVNDALASIGAGIASMSKGIPLLSIGIPQQSSVAGLRALAQHIETSPGIRLATLAALPKPQSIFNGSGESAAEDIIHLLPARFPAAWNAARLDVFGDPAHPHSQLCPVVPIPVLMDDHFPTEFSSDFLNSFPRFEPPDAPAPDFFASDLQHGITTTTVMGANAIGSNAFPFSGCIDLRLVQLARFLDMDLQIDDLFIHMPEGRFIVNYSAGIRQSCDTSPCQPPFGNVLDPLFFATKALHWKEMTRSRWPDFLMVVAAGNDNDEDSAQIYSGMGDSRFESAMTISQLADTGFQFVSEDDLWSPSPDFLAEGFVSIKPTESEQTQLELAIEDAGLSGPDAIADNVIVVGSTIGQNPNSALTHVTGDNLRESDFSENNPDVLAVGENIFNDGKDGTSFSAPQVTGLASFLWMISPDLRDLQPISVTKRAIVANARSRFIDAYATVLSLDEATLPTPDTAQIRMNLLDIDGINGFTEGDIDLFLRAYFEEDAQGNITDQPVAPTQADFTFLDLNGDGFTGGSTTERFDLDRVGSTQYGTSVYSTNPPVLQNINGTDVPFDEIQLTDLQILCYYAYSDLFTGDNPTRDQMLSGRCTPITVTVDPAQATVHVGGTQQFAAAVHGISDPRVTWTVTGNNTIDANGLLTAGSTPGTFTVRAASVVDPNASGTATLTIPGNADCASVLAGLQTELRIDLDAAPHSTTKKSSTATTLTDSLSGDVAEATATVNYGSGTASTNSPDTGNVSTITGSSAEASFDDLVVVVPDDPSLMLKPMTVTATATVTGNAEITGERARAEWDGFLSAGGNASHVVDLSTLPGQSSGENGQATLSTTSSLGLFFGSPMEVLGSFHVLTAYPCNSADAECPPHSPAGTGTANASVSFQMGKLTIRDQAGNAVGVTVCSVGGFNYQ